MSRLDDLKNEHRYLMLDTLEEWGFDISEIRNEEYQIIKLFYTQALSSKIESMEKQNLLI